MQKTPIYLFKIIYQNWIYKILIENYQNIPICCSTHKVFVMSLQGMIGWQGIDNLPPCDDKTVFRQALSMCEKEHS